MEKYLVEVIVYISGKPKVGTIRDNLGIAFNGDMVEGFDVNHIEEIETDLDD